MLSATRDELRAVARAADDAAGYFPAMYATVTDRVRQAATDGRFADAERMERFAVAFARRYLAPRAGAVAVPRCWQATFDVAGDHRLLIVQHLLLGINAHVNHDLPLVVVQLADEGDDRDGLRADFDAINDVLAESLPTVVRRLGGVSRWVNVVAARGGGRLFDFSLATARSQAWRAAERLLRLDRAARARDVAELDRLVGGVAYVVAHQGPPTSWGIAAGRLLEEDDPHVVTAALLGPDG